MGPYQVANRITPITYMIEDVPVRKKKKTWKRFLALSQLKSIHLPRDNE
jgi:hypothetical protein